MGFRYLHRVASEENIRQFLELADLAAGAGASAENVFLLSHRLRDSKPMQLCHRRLERDPDALALINARRACGPYDLAALRALPRGSLGHTYATVLETMGYDINFFPKPEFFNTSIATLTTSTTACTPRTTSTTSSPDSASTTSASSASASPSSPTPAWPSPT